jgi:hypothetical protein
MAHAMAGAGVEFSIHVCDERMVRCRTAARWAVGLNAVWAGVWVSRSFAWWATIKSEKPNLFPDRTAVVKKGLPNSPAPSALEEARVISSQNAVRRARSVPVLGSLL